MRIFRIKGQPIVFNLKQLQGNNFKRKIFPAITEILNLTTKIDLTITDSEFCFFVIFLFVNIDFKIYRYNFVLVIF